ncbi:hypothetical protein Vretimale_3993 [Volvox reticuliferus]|uniref:Uncharacterized protein n=1 Tax=Volvox reticuliferus TaxID=1737510 RepID=A0A8J4DEZ8_9CHLO|nr:hypothetical protein Vretimale_3993 [Volvox reticuliferus]
MRLFSPSFSGLGASSQPPLTKLAYQALTTMMTHGSTDTWRRGIGVGTEWPLSILSISLAVRTHRVFMKRVLALAGKALLCDLGWHAWQRCRTANKMVVQQAQVQAEAAGLSGTVSERVLKCLPLPVQNTRPVCSESAVSGHRPAQLSSGCTAADMGVSGTGTDAGLGVRPRSPATTTDTGQPNGLRPMGPAADVVSCAELQFGAGSSLTNGGAGPIRQPGATSGGRPMGHLGQHSNAGENGAQTSAVDAAPRRRTGAVALAASSAGCAVTATTATNPSCRTCHALSW